jgi:SAM-dependent methyltransferase
MAHLEQQEFLKNCLGEIVILKNKEILEVLEVGSYKVNAKNSFRHLIPNSKYIGIDLIKGPEVDIVMNGCEIEKLNKKFDIIISGECFEHASNWKEIFSSMVQNIKDDGFVVLTMASKGRIEHGTSRSNPLESPGTNDEYYKNLTKNDFLKNFEIKNIFEEYFFFYNIHSFDLYFFGAKKKTKNNLSNNLKKKTFQSNLKFLKILTIKRYIMSSLLPEKIYQDLHFFNKNRKKKN